MAPGNEESLHALRACVTPNRGGAVDLENEGEMGGGRGSVKSKCVVAGLVVLVISGGVN
jgi:hypothetical protein